MDYSSWPFCSGHGLFGTRKSAVWLLLPLYLVPVVSHSEVLLTILIFTYILGIWPSASTSCSAMRAS